MNDLPPAIHAFSATSNGEWIASLLSNRGSLTVTVPSLDDCKTFDEKRKVFKTTAGSLTFSPAISGITGRVKYGHWNMGARYIQTDSIQTAGWVLTVRIRREEKGPYQIIEFGYWARANESPGELKIWVSRVKERLQRRLGPLPPIGPLSWERRHAAGPR